MTHLINTKVLLSGVMILAAAAVIIGATFAFFSDTETSVDNTFVAGEIDLLIDNTSYALDHNIPNFDGTPSGALVASTQTTWTLTDLTVEKFFNFEDLKPGDYGEDTISIHVNDNDAWLCAAARITADDDNDFSEPEDEVSLPNNDDNDGTTDGDLDDGLNFAFWVDDGDNILEDDEDGSIFLSGPLSGLNPEGQIALADSSGTGPFGSTPIIGGEDAFIGKAWCYGEFTATPEDQDGTNTSNPVEGGTGFECDGSNVGNIGQTDSVTGDLQFYATQSRNNDDFLCSEDYDPVWPVEE